MDLLFEFLFELIVGSILDGVNDSKLPRRLRVDLLIIASLIYTIFAAFFVWLILTSKNMFLKIVLGAVVLLFASVFITLWHKVIKAKK